MSLYFEAASLNKGITKAVPSNKVSKTVVELKAITHLDFLINS